MQLSEEDCGLIRKMANEVSAPNWQLPAYKAIQYAKEQPK